jgi:hypothetical protein
MMDLLKTLVSSRIAEESGWHYHSTFFRHHYRVINGHTVHEQLVMRRKLPNGKSQYRELTEAEQAEWFDRLQ